jgi:tetratricopeptide (TPR) repeat protein
MKKNLANEMVTAPDNFRAYWTLAQLDVTNIMIAGKIDQELAESANMYFDKAHMMNPENIFVLLDKAQLATMLGDFDKARDLVIQSIELAPGYDQNYTIADSLNEISPDKDFGNKIKELKAKNEIE